jgi:beta-mannanase
MSSVNNQSRNAHLTSHSSIHSSEDVIFNEDDGMDENDIEYNELLDESNSMASNNNRLTRADTYTLRRQMVVDSIKQYLKNIQTVEDVEYSIITATKIFKIIKVNRWLLTNYDNFRQAVIDKLLEFNNDEMLYARTWFFELFDTSIGDYISTH